jgi:cell division protease FtsH
MVTKFGMSEKLGNIDYANEQFSYLGPQAGGVNAGPDTHEVIDQEVRRLVDEGYETAKRILTEKRDDLDRLAQGLLEYETLTGKEIDRVIAGQPLNRGDDGDGNAAADTEGPSGIAAIPKIGKAARPSRGGDGLEPEPAT